uniref:dnaJ homolog subfamily C member 24 isoform X2 n=1 Tax=Gasterosteus aculeatus aculeatus TaxID=481459 RepID=UPI001A99F97F|nr:dnaJ homolog subfamily C member 24 isoform X2 [Gasterosteus aculeatus aculeatus]
MGDAAEQDLYAVLGAGPSDSAQQLRHRYQRLALQYHPDRHAGSSSAEAESGMKRFLEVDAAWRVLGDQTTRRQYDLQRRAQELKQDWPVDSVVHLQDMIWEQSNYTPSTLKHTTLHKGHHRVNGSGMSILYEHLNRFFSNNVVPEFKFKSNW